MQWVWGTLRQRVPLMQKLPGGHQHGACKDQIKVQGGWEDTRKGGYKRRQAGSGQWGPCSQVRMLEYLLNVTGSPWKILSRGKTILDLYLLSKPLWGLCVTLGAMSRRLTADKRRQGDYCNILSRKCWLPAWWREVASSGIYLRQHPKDLLMG